MSRRTPLIIPDDSVVLFLVCAMLTASVLSGCGTPGARNENEERSIYHVPEVTGSPELSDRDRKLANRVREFRQEQHRLKKSFAFQGRLLRYLSSLSDDEIRNKVSGEGRDLAAPTSRSSIPIDAFGRWFRIRGTLVGPPQDNPFNGKLGDNLKVQQFTLQNPEGFPESSAKQYFVVVSLQPFTNLDRLDRVIELDGFLWNAWDLEKVISSNRQNTSQKKLPILFVRSFRRVEQ